MIAGDRLVSIDGEAYDATNTLQKYNAHAVGTPVLVRVRRGREELGLQLKCLDAEKSDLLWRGMVEATADGRWKDCIQKTYELEGLSVKSARFAGMRGRCQDAERIESRRVYGSADAAALFEYWRRRITESSYVPDSLAGIRADLLSAMATLRSSNFTDFATELEQLWVSVQQGAVTSPQTAATEPPPTDAGRTSGL
jgi:hypothetical protein